MFTYLLQASLLGLLGVADVAPPATGLRLLAPEELRAIPLAELPYAGFSLPEQVDLSPDMPVPGYQGQQNACVAWASAYAVKSYQEKIEQRHPLIQDGQPQWQHIFSPAFSYNQINQGRDGGATLIDALNLLSARGALPWSEMPYDPDNYTRQPGAEQLAQAKAYRIAYWRQVNVADPQELKAQLHAGYPVMIGALIDEGLWKLKAGQRWQRRQGQSLGGHALVVGYHDQKQAFKVMSSWGSRWSEGGFGWIDYRYFRRVVREGYVAKDAPTRLPNLAILKTEASQAEDAARQQKQAVPQLPTLPAPTPSKDAELAQLLQKQQTASLQQEAVQRQRPSRDFLTMQAAYDGYFLTFRGHFGADPQAGHQARVLVRLFTDPAGHQPLRLPDARWQLPDGQGVIPSGHFKLLGGAQAWQARVPLQSVLAQTQRLWAQPVLYLDDFGVQRGPLSEIQLPE